MKLAQSFHHNRRVAEGVWMAVAWIYSFFFHTIDGRPTIGCTLYTYRPCTGRIISDTHCSDFRLRCITRLLCSANCSQCQDRIIAFWCYSPTLPMALCAWLPPPMRLCFHRRLFVCLFVSRTMQKLHNRFSQNSVERWHTGHGRND